jgi:hypothetical protein
MGNGHCERRAEEYHDEEEEKERKTERGSIDQENERRNEDLVFTNLLFRVLLLSLLESIVKRLCSAQKKV